jgi:hypothetical protein
MTIVGEPEAYATTEPVMASEQAPPVTPESVTTDDESGDAERASREESADRGQFDSGEEPGNRRELDSTDESANRRESDAADGSADHAPAEAGAAVAETDDTGRSAADLAEESPQERYDPTPTRDWAADEGELLEQNSERGDRLEAERADLARDDDTSGTRASDDATGATASDDATDATASEDPTGATASTGRRVSGFDELRDGGFGVGSAAPLDDGAQPLDHPVQAYRDTMTYRMPGDPGYDSAQPNVWFYDEGAAQRNGFRRSEG